MHLTILSFYPVLSLSWCLLIHLIIEQIHPTLPEMKKKYVEIFLHYRQVFVKGDIFIGEWEIFGAEVFLHYSQFFIKGDFVIDGIGVYIVTHSIYITAFLKLIQIIYLHILVSYNIALVHLMHQIIALECL